MRRQSAEGYQGTVSPPRRSLALLGLCLAACSLPTSTEPSPLEREARLAARVQAERAADRVRALCRLGPRMGGTPSGDAAAEFLAQAFADHGLEVRVDLDPPVHAHWETSWSLEARASGGETRALASAWPWGHSPSAAGTAKLALEDRAAGAWLAAEAVRGEVLAAVVLIDGEVTLDGNWPVVQHLRGSHAHVPHFGISAADGQWLRERLARGETLEIEHALVAQTVEAPARSVVARLPGRASSAGAWSAEHFLVCAHGDSDSGGPGANDNASGVAALLEVAAAWSEAVAEGTIEPPEREVRFAVWGTEIHSSRAYLERCAAAGERILGVLNFDQSGFGSTADRVFVEPDDVPNNVPLARALLGVLADHAPRGRSDVPAEFPREWASVPSLGGTDSYVFGPDGRGAVGVPSMTVYSSAWGRPQEHPRTPEMPGESWRERESVEVDYDLHYHSAGDTPQNTTDREPWNAAWCARVALLGARRFLAGTDAAP